MNDFLAGIIAGGTGIFVGYPFDVMKTYSQAEQHNKTRYVCKFIYDKHGILGFYRGILAPLLCRMPSKGILFASYEQVLHLDLLKEKNKYLRMGMSGVIASIPSALLSSPTDLIKITNQRAIKFIPHIRKAGYKSIIKGYRETLMVAMPYYLIYFPLYNILKENKIPMAGGIAGTIPWMIVFPLDTIKTTSQLPDPKYTIKEIWKKEKLRGLYRGLFPTILRAFPTHYVTLRVYDWIREYII